MGEKRALKVVAALLSAASSLATAAPTLDCRIDTSQYFVTVGSFGRLPRDSVISLAVRGNLQNGQPVQYGKDEPIVVADLEVIRSTPLLVPTVDITYLQDKFLGHKFKLARGRPLEVEQELILPDGRAFSVAILSKDHALLLSQATNQLCSAAVAYNVPDPYWVQGMSQQATEASIERRVTDEVLDKAGLRIVFTGLSAGTLNFQEVLVSGSQIRTSKTRSFDQFAKSIHVGPFDFDVLAATGGQVTLRYNIASRSQLEARDAGAMGLRAVRLASTSALQHGKYVPSPASAASSQETRRRYICR